MFDFRSVKQKKKQYKKNKTIYNFIQLLLSIKESGGNWNVGLTQDEKFLFIELA